MNNVIKCPHCNKVFFEIGSNICPHCGKNIYDVFDLFKDIFNFGKDKK